MIGCGVSIGKLSSLRRTIQHRAKAILKKHGSNAHLYLPGVSVTGGFIPGNYFDSAGTTLASVDGSVGLVLDAAGSVGAELVTNGDFSSGMAGWYNNAGTGAVSNGELIVTGAAAGNDVDQLLTLVANKTYVVTGTVTAGTTGGYISIMRGSSGGYAGLGSTPTVSAGIQPVRLVFVATGSDVIVTLRVSAAGNAKFDNISVKEITGIHATQSTPGFKPTIRRVSGLNYLELDGVDDRIIASSLNTDTSGLLVVGATPKATGWRMVAGSGAQTGSNAGVRLGIDGGNGQWVFDTASGSGFTHSYSVDVAQINTPVVLSGRWVQGGQQQLRLNSVLKSSGSSVASPSSQGFAFGAGQYAAGQGDYFNGNIHCVLAIKGTVSDADLIVLEKFVAQLSGVTL